MFELSEFRCKYFIVSIENCECLEVGVELLAVAGFVLMCDLLGNFLELTKAYLLNVLDVLIDVVPEAIEEEHTKAKNFIDGFLTSLGIDEIDHFLEGSVYLTLDGLIGVG